MKVLTRRFYERDPEIVAKDLLGKILIRRLPGETLKGILVETEAYYGLEDPASRAHNGLKAYNKSMWSDPGKAFIYNVHKYWMLNAVAHEPRRIGAVLIRAVEPTDGIDIMKRHRKVSNILDLTSGPGKLTQAFRINKKFNEKPLTVMSSEVWIEQSKIKCNVESSHRIGVKRDLKKKLRFFINGNRFVSR